MNLTVFMVLVVIMVVVIGRASSQKQRRRAKIIERYRTLGCPCLFTDSDSVEPWEGIIPNPGCPLHGEQV